MAGSAGADGDGVADPWTLIQSRHAFQDLMTGSTPKRVIGVAKVASTLQQSRGGASGYGSEEIQAHAPYETPLTESVPTLEEMTRAALNVLDNDPDGFFLMVEGGAVDWASHANQLGRMIEEQVDFNKSVDAAVAWVSANSSWDETLVIVTGDHECGYLTGPDSGPDGAAADSGEEPVWNPVVNNGQGVLPGAEWHSGSHTNSIIPFYARGAGASLFRHCADECDPVRGRYIDNTDIALVMFSLFGADAAASPPSRAGFGDQFDM